MIYETIDWLFRGILLGAVLKNRGVRLPDGAVVEMVWWNGGVLRYRWSMP